MARVRMDFRDSEAPPLELRAPNWCTDWTPSHKSWQWVVQHFFGVFFCIVFFSFDRCIFVCLFWEIVTLRSPVQKLWAELIFGWHTFKLCVTSHPPSKMAAISKSRMFIKKTHTKKNQLKFSVKFRSQPDNQVIYCMHMGASCLHLLSFHNYFLL